MADLNPPPPADASGAPAPETVRALKAAAAARHTLTAHEWGALCENVSARLKLLGSTELEPDAMEDCAAILADPGSHRAEVAAGALELRRMLLVDPDRRRRPISSSSGDALEASCTVGTSEPCVNACGTTSIRFCRPSSFPPEFPPDEEGEWSDCGGPPEICNGEDDDCDGEADEGTCDDGFTCTADLCAVGDGDPCFTMCVPSPGCNCL